MAHDIANFFERIVAPAALGKGLMPRYKNRLLDAVYNGYRAGQVGHIGMPTVINIPVVNEADVTDIGNGALQVSAKDEKPVTLTIDFKPSVSKKIESFDQIRTPADLQSLYMQGMLESLLRKSNRMVAGLLTPANFNAYTPAKIVSASQTAFTRLDVSGACANVVGTGCAPESPGDLTFLTDQSAYYAMVGDKANDWITQAIVGTAAAEAAQQRAELPTAFNAGIAYDQMIPTTTPKSHGGFLFHRMAIGMLPLVEPKPQATSIDHMVSFPTPGGNFPVMVQFGYSLEQQGYILHMYSIFGLKVVKPEWGQCLETTPTP